MYKRVNELLGTNYKSDKEVYFGNICLKEKINEEFVEEFSDKLNWGYISMNPSLTENFIRNHVDKIDFVNISSCSTLSEDFIREFSDRLDWKGMSSRQILSERLMEEFRKRINWGTVSQYQSMSEEFIERHKDRVDWDSISVNQVLSWDFILKFKDLVNWRLISLAQIYINPDYKSIKLYELKDNRLYNLYQETKERGWFVGYIVPGFSKRVFKDFPYEFFSLVLAPGDYIKARIYWEDLIMKRVTSKFEPIREIKYV